MNLVFALSSVGLLGTTLWMVVADYAKPWKRLQSEFRTRERQKLEAESQQAAEKINQEQLAVLQQDIEQQQAALAAHGDEIRRLEQDLERVKDKVYEADARWRQTKSHLDTARFRYEEAVQGGEPGEIAERKARVDELATEFRENKKTLEEETATREALAEQLAARRADLRAAEERLKALREGVTNLETRVANLKKGVDYFVLNAPLFDFLRPSLKIEQAILPDLLIDINFTSVPRVDRCMTCHVAANRPGFTSDGVAGNGGEPGWSHPFQSHPRLDLFVGDSSPHPYNRFGCTVCHAGLDRATDFARAGHSPASEEQQGEWRKKWGWEPQKYLDYPVLPAGTAEAGCISCHAREVWTPASEVQDVGRELITRMGCYGCHVINYESFTQLRKSGPDLRRIAGKTTPGWAARWLRAPREFRPTTWMPHFFYLENVKGEKNLARQQAEIAGIVGYLWQRSERPTYPDPPPGSPAAGQVLFESIGCTGCHVKDRGAERDAFYPQFNRLHGPNLVRTGSKVDSGWLYAWLKDPRGYFPATSMPNLRLTDQEAADLAAYLAADRDASFENLTVPAADPAVRDELVLGYLQNNLTIEQSQARLEAMGAAERDVYLGQQSIAKYGCFGCHDIAGFEDAKPIGTELTQEGSKPLHQFDFGHVHDVPHTRHDWILGKLLTPRLWDHGKEEVKDYQELYKMPSFGFSEREARAVATNVLGFIKPTVRPELQAGQGPEGAARAAGRKLVTRYNCQACHLVEGKGRAIRAVLARDLLPPSLAAEGARVQSDWLFGFLHDPGQVQLRPWLTVRMPTFGFTDEEANTLVSYFSALDGREAFLSPAQAGAAREQAVGEAVFTLLQCARCHPAGAEAAAASGQASAAELAPSLLLARERLRWDWVPAWIKDPQSWIPGTNMPTNFPKMGEGRYSSPLLFVFDSPTFAASKQRLLPHFGGSEAELKAYLGDVDRVTTALRDHIWTLR
jgi:cytochrome c2